MIDPKKEQLDFLEWEFGVFFHFGIRTFYEDHKDWDMKAMPKEAFNPQELDCNQWIITAKEAGAKYAILVCKHHDGFANWPSKYTDYSVANTPWKNGKGDVVREFTDACRAHGLNIGLYYSPAEFGFYQKTPTEYDDYFINQISELLTNYGKIDYLWFDGCGSEDHKYDTSRIVAKIRELQPRILLFNMWDPDTRWVGNESGYAHMPNELLVTNLSFSVKTETLDQLGFQRFLPVECDMRMRRKNWFYSSTDENTVKTLEELMGIYYYTIGRGANLLLNIGPDRRGLLPEKDSSRLREFGDCIRKTFANPLNTTFTKTNSNTYTVELNSPALVNHMVIKEKSLGLVKKFHIRCFPYDYGEPIKVFQSDTIGRKAVCLFPTFFTQKLELVIDEGECDILEIFCF